MIISAVNYGIVNAVRDDCTNGHYVICPGRFRIDHYKSAHLSISLFPHSRTHTDPGLSLFQFVKDFRHSFIVNFHFNRQVQFKYPGIDPASQAVIYQCYSISALIIQSIKNAENRMGKLKEVFFHWVPVFVFCIDQAE